MALEEMDSVALAFVDKGVTLYLTGTEAPDQEELKKMLAKYKMQVTGMEKTEELPF